MPRATRPQRARSQRISRRFRIIAALDARSPHRSQQDRQQLHTRHSFVRLFKMRAACLYARQEIAEAPYVDGRGSPSGDVMFWLFSFRSRNPQAEYSWRPSLRAPNGRAIAALMTFSGN
ncbi:hypothetical protein ACFSCV_14245 [Methylopila henanensis]